MKIFIESTFKKVLFSKYYLRKFEGIRIHLLVQLITVTEIELLRIFDGMSYLLTSSLKSPTLLYTKAAPFCEKVKH